MIITPRRRFNDLKFNSRMDASLFSRLLLTAPTHTTIVRVRHLLSLFTHTFTAQLLLSSLSFTFCELAHMLCLFDVSVPWAVVALSVKQMFEKFEIIHSLFDRWSRLEMAICVDTTISGRPGS